MKTLLQSIIVFCIPFAAFAESEHKFEFWTGGLADVSITSMSGTINTQGNILGTAVGNGVLVGLPTPTIGYHWKYGLEFLVTPSLNFLIPSSGNNNQAPDGSTVISRFTGGVAYHFSEEVMSSYYVRLDSGVAIYKSAGQTTTNYVGSVQFGKKFKLTESIALAPNILFEFISTSPYNSAGITLTPLQFCLFL